MARIRTWFSRSRLGLFSGGIVSLLAFSIFFSGYAASTADALSAQPKVLAEMSAVTPLLSYQGRLLDPATGAPKPNGTYTFVFRIYNVASDGSALWTETKDLNVSNGLFVTLLGDTTPLPATIFTGQNLWLGIKVGADAEATPRQRLAPVAYAMYADNASRLDGKASTAFAAASHTHSGAEIVNGTISTSKLADGSVTAAKIANEAVGDAQIQDRTRTLSFPTGALNFDPTSTTIKQTSNGLDWERAFAGAAFLNIVRPDDWDGRSNVSLIIHFYPTTNTAGNVDFFIRPRAFNVGSTYQDASSINSTPVAVSGASIIQKQVFTIPASRFGNNELWVIAIQNQGSGSTYPNAVRVLSVSLSYNAVR